MERGQLPAISRRPRWVALLTATLSMFVAMTIPAQAKPDDGSKLDIEKHPKIATALLDDAGLEESGPGLGNGDGTWTDDQGRTKVVLEGNATAIAKAVKAAGGRVLTESTGVVSAFVPNDEIADLAESKTVSAVREPTPLYPMVTSEGVVETGADVWHSDDITGTGVKVAVVDVGFAGHAALLGTELPASVTTQSFCANGMNGGPTGSAGIEHGTGVAEIVYDMAPGAQLFFVCVDDLNGFKLAGDYLVAQGIRIANASIGNAIAGRGDGSGADLSFAGVVRKTRLAGVLWVVSSGNLGDGHYNWTPTEKTSTRGSLYFGPGDTGFEIQVSNADVNGDGLAGRAFVSAKWDAWPTTSTDVDFYIYNSLNAFLIGPGAAIAGGILDQNGDDPPIEVVANNTGLGWANATAGPAVYLLEANLFSGPIPPNMRIDLFFEGDITAVQGLTDSNVVEPASSPYALAVGAYDVSDGEIEFYSSRGTTIDNRPKPDLVAPDAVASTTYEDGFTGTSAAAPHVAGAAALLLGENPALDIQELQNELMGLAEDMGAPGIDNVSGYGRLRLGPAVTPEPETGSLFTALDAPVRVLDTRGGDCIGPKCDPFEADESLDLPVAGEAGVPEDATAVVLNVTAVAPKGESFVTVWPTGAARPNTSNLNFVAGQTVPNSVTTRVGDDGSISLFNDNGEVDLLVDVMGYYDSDAGGSGFVPLSKPVRAVDTRPAGCVAAGGRCSKLNPGETVSFKFRDRTFGTDTVPANATAVVLNVTATEGDQTGFITVFPGGVGRPATSNLNFTPFLTVPNLVVVGIGDNHNVSFYNSNGTTHLLVDVIGYYVPGGGGRYVPMTPIRAVDTRIGTGLRMTPLANATAFNMQARYLNGVPLDASAVLANATIVAPTATGFFASFAGGLAFPGTSNLNYTAGKVVPNSVIAGIGADGTVALYASTGTPHVLFDLQGYFITPPPPA